MKVNLKVEVRTTGTLDNMALLNEIWRALQLADVDGFIKSVKNTDTGQEVGTLAYALEL